MDHSGTISRVRLRVLHCLQRIDSGGPEVRRLSLARGLEPRRYEQRVLCTQACGGLPSQFQAAGVHVTEVGSFDSILDPRPYQNALAAVRRFRPHIIHGAVYEGIALAAIAGRLGRVPIVIAEETSDPVKRSWRGNALMRVLTGLAHRVVAVSPATQKYLRQRIYLPASKVILINNGVTEAPTADASSVQSLREQLGIEHTDLIIGTVGRLYDEHKRQSDLIRALPLVRQAHPEARLLIVGAGQDERTLRALAQALGVSKQVVFAGYQPDPTPLYQMMDVFALASQWEAFGLVLVEAMFAGLPVVATRVGGIPSIVNERETGFLVPPSDPAAIADALLALCRDAALRERMGAAGLTRARAQFTAERYVREVDALYQALANERLSGRDECGASQLRRT